MTAAAPARRFGLTRKGRLAPGCDADLCLRDAGARWTVRHADMESRVGFNPWEGVAITGRPVLVALRGRIVMRDGRIDGSARGHGRLVAMEAGA